MKDVKKHKYTLFKNREVFNKYRFEALSWTRLTEKEKTAMIDHEAERSERWPEILYVTDNLDDAKRKFEELKDTLDSGYHECQRELILEEICLEDSGVIDVDDDPDYFDTIDYFLKDIPVSEYVDKLLEDLDCESSSLDFDSVVKDISSWYDASDIKLPEPSFNPRGYACAVQRYWMKHELDAYSQLSEEDIEYVLHTYDINIYADDLCLHTFEMLGGWSDEERAKGEENYSSHINDGAYVLNESPMWGLSEEDLQLVIDKACELWRMNYKVDPIPDPTDDADEVEI